MASPYGISEEEFRIAKLQAERRAKLRQEFLKQKTNPWKHAAEAGYVFDPAMQKFNSMKVTQFDHFQPNKRNTIFGVCSIVIPMFLYGYLIYNERNNREMAIRAGKIPYKDRLFKLC